MGNNQTKTDLIGKSFGKFKIEKIIGEGSYGIVYQVKSNDGVVKAFKFFFLKKGDLSGIKNLLEIDILTRLHHPYKLHSDQLILPYDFKSLLGSADIKGWGMVLPLAEGSLGKLHHLFGVKQIIKFISQCVSGLQFLHSVGIAHLDVKPNNMLIIKENRKYKCIISDFGTAIMLDINRTRSFDLRSGFTMMYAAPEILLPNDKFGGPPSDMWSVGASLFSLLSGDFLVPNDVISKERFFNITVYQKLLNRYLEPDVLKERIDSVVHASKEIKNLLLNLLQKDYLKRLNAEEVLMHLGMEVTDGSVLYDEISSKQLQRVKDILSQSQMIFYLEIVEKYFSQYSMGIIFTSVDIFYKVVVEFKNTSKYNLLTVFLTSLFMSLKIRSSDIFLPKDVLQFQEKSKNLSVNSREYLKTSRMPHISQKNILDMELTILHCLRGSIGAGGSGDLYQKCSTKCSLFTAYELLIDPALYSAVNDFDEVFRELNGCQRGNEKMKTSSVFDFFQVINSYSDEPEMSYD